MNLSEDSRKERARKSGAAQSQFDLAPSSIAAATTTTTTTTTDGACAISGRKEAHMGHPDDIHMVLLSRKGNLEGVQWTEIVRAAA